MLSIKASANATSALTYFDTEITRGDYLTNRGGILGKLHGRAAEMLGLPETCGRAEYAALLNNVNPVTGAQITERMHPDRIPGYDFTFGTPKTYTMLYERLVTDGRLEEAAALLKVHDHAVMLGMSKVEEDIQAQVNEADGKHYTRTTGNMAWAGFTHFDARPVDGVADRFIHTHAYLFNFTHDDKSGNRGGGKWKAVDLYQTMLDRVYYQAVYFQSLAAGMQSLGYEVERQGNSFELKGVARETIDKFSRRSAQVKERAEKLGVTGAKAKRNLASVTRAGKEEGLSEEETRKVFFERQSDEEKAVIGRHAAHTGKPVSPTGPSATDAIDHAIRHWSERKSVVGLKRFYETAIMRAVTSGLSLEDVEKAARNHPSLVFGRDKYGNEVVTTHEARAEERKLRDFVEARSVPSYAELRIAKGLPEYTIARTWLSQEQQAAVNHVMTSIDRVIGIRGGAGTGKTTTMEETIEAIEEASGKKVVVLAPTTTASHETLRESGFANAETIAKFLVDRNLQKEARGSIIYVDEAGMVGAPTMRRLLELSEHLGARVVLQGDTRQHASVERGDALRYLEEHGGLKFAELKEIRRQEPPEYKRAVESFAKGEAGDGFAKLRELGWVHEVTGEADGALHEKLVGDYLDVLDKAPKNAPRHKIGIIIATTHEEGDAVTDVVRKGMRARGKLGKEREGLSRLVPETWTAAERTEAHRYHAGHVVEFQQNAEGFTKGDRLYVRGVINGQVLVSTTKEGAVDALRIGDLGSRFQVYQERELALAVGDVVRVTQGGKDADGERVNRNARYIVQGFDGDGRVLLGTKTPHTTVGGPVAGNTVRKLSSKEAIHISYGYAMTSHASQSVSVDYVFSSLRKQSFVAMSQEQAYVSNSRGRKASYVYTDDYDGMVRAAERSGARMFASDVKDVRRKPIAKPANAPVVARTAAPKAGAASKATRPPKLDVPGVVLATEEQRRKEGEDRSVATRAANRDKGNRDSGKGFAAAAWAKIRQTAYAMMQAAFGQQRRENAVIAACAYAAIAPGAGRVPRAPEPPKPVLGKYTRQVQERGPDGRDTGRER
jgi:conjugative relaxase-like TrwC/TraI family protein